jgi:hypothetical protein
MLIVLPNQTMLGSPARARYGCCRVAAPARHSLSPIPSITSFPLTKGQSTWSAPSWGSTAPTRSGSPGSGRRRCTTTSSLPPDGFDSWDGHYRDIGVGEEDFGIGEDSIADPHGEGPRIWFQRVPEGKTVKNRLHLDIYAGGDRSVPIQTRKARVDAAAQRLMGLGAAMTRVLAEPGLDHYAVAMTDPEGNEFDINSPDEVPDSPRAGRAMSAGRRSAQPVEITYAVLLAVALLAGLAINGWFAANADERPTSCPGRLAGDIHARNPRHERNDCVVGSSGVVLASWAGPCGV